MANESCVWKVWARPFVRPDRVGPNCLQMLSEDNKSSSGRLRVNCNIIFIFLRKWALEFMSIILRHSQKLQDDYTNDIFFYSLSARTKYFVKITVSANKKVPDLNTVKPCHSKIDKTKVLKTNGSLMKVESIAECSPGIFCNTFDLH